MVSDGAWVGGLPAIAIGIQNPQEFEPHDPKRPQAGVLQIDTSPSNLRLLIDGLARVSAALDMLGDPAVPAWQKEALKKLYIPVTIYMPHTGSEALTVEEMGQLFHDFNVLGESVSKGMAIDLDQSDIYVQLVQRLSNDPIFTNNGGVDQRGAATPRKGTLVTKITLVKMARAAIEGPGSHVDHYTDSVGSPNLQSTNLTEHQLRLANFLELIAKQMGPLFSKPGSILLSTPGWIALGLVYHDIYSGNLKVELSEGEKEKFVTRIGKIDWSPSNPDFLKFLGSQATDKTTGKPAIDPQTGHPVLRMFGGSKAFYNLAGYIRYKIGLTDLLTEPQFGNPENFEMLIGSSSLAA
jgi:hypothetical protein